MCFIIAHMTYFDNGNILLHQLHQMQKQQIEHIPE